MTEADWSTSRSIGFLTGAINRTVAQDNLDEEGLFSVQLGVWEDLTSCAADLFATRLYLLSSEGDREMLKTPGPRARHAVVIQPELSNQHHPRERTCNTAK